MRLVRNGNGSWLVERRICTVQRTVWEFVAMFADLETAENCFPDAEFVIEQFEEEVA